MKDLRSRELPKGWAEACLGDIALNVRPKEDPKAYRTLPFIGMEHVEAHTMRLIGSVPASAMSSNAVHFYPRDVLYGRLRPYLNKVLVADSEGMCSAEFIPLTTPSGVEPRYLAYALNSAHFVSFASRIIEGDRPRVDYGDIAGYPLGIAPSQEQHRIVEAIESHFTRLDAAVATLQRVKTNLRRYRASVLKAAVEGRLVPAEAELARQEGRDYEPAVVLLGRILRERRRRWEETELAKLKATGKTPEDDRWKKKYREPVAPDTSKLPELPEGWCWVRLDSVSDVQLGQQRHPQYTSAKVKLPYIRSANITWDGLDLTDVKEMGFPNAKRYRLEYGDILLAEASGSPMEAGKPVIWRNEIPGAYYQKTVLRVRAIDKDSLLPGFLRLVFLHDCVSGKFARLAPGVGIVHITAERLSEWAVPIPPLMEQHRIVGEVSRIESCMNEATTEATNQLKRLPRLRQAVLKWAFEGKLVDQDSTDEPASVLLERIKMEGAQAQGAKQKKPRWVRFRSTA